MIPAELAADKVLHPIEFRAWTLATINVPYASEKGDALRVLIGIWH